MKLRIKPFEEYRVGPAYALSAATPLESRTGRVTVITGESGTGKSILLQALAGLRDRASTGDSIEADVFTGEDDVPTPLAAFLREPTRLSYLPQHTVLRPALTPARTVRDWCALLTAAYGVDAPVRHYVNGARDELEERLFSRDERRRLFGEGVSPRIRHLSGGQQRRLDVMMALCSPAELILLDEPDTGLDAARRRALWETLVAFARRHARIILLVSHYAGDEFDVDGVDVWRATRDKAGGGATLAMASSSQGAPVRLPLHDAPPERGNQRLDQFVIYARQRAAALRTGRSGLLLLAPPLLMGAVRLAMYPREAVDGPSMGMLFFYAVTCFWLGTAQSTGFWSDEHFLFTRECRQGASSVSYLLSFVAVAALFLALQIALGALVLKYLSWSALFRGDIGALGRDLRVGVGRIYLWGCWAGLNGLLTGLLGSSIQHGVRPHTTSPGTAQLLALLITLSAIVFSFPVIGSRAYADVTGDPFSADRLHVSRDAARALPRAEAPALAMLLAELPLAANPSFHGLWFQGERPLRYRMPRARFDAAQKEGVPEALINAAVLAGACGVVLAIGKRLKDRPPAG